MMGETGLSREEKMKTIKFLLYTPNSPNNAKVLDVDDISSLAPVNIKWDTKVLIHGWKGDRTGFQKIKD
ncbi:unnamed protein product, partial [Timema podura]|nr:unnamed protein product [Timema podura]